ncbi:MAG: U32 family peptidase [Clostridia bacterium]|nr:U32 family peptidase [Clostridia bacterium]
MSNLEILAPVGSEKSFYCAINNGADAVYLGLKNFNARDKAQNFNVENIRDYVEYAHLHNVKVYITVNTILTDSELPKMLEMVEGAVNARVDAFIVQDLGVATLLKNTFNNINLHASTQMGIHSLQGAKVAEELGFSRIVLSRETSIEDIKEIKQNTNLEIEYFVQGALCVCFSGNCYFSSLAFNESGNRGRCLQPCRLPYISKANGEELNKGYLLSTTDLCFIKRVKQLKDLGICSLKIEGRLRRPAYVAYATKVYAMAKRALLGKIDFNEFEAEENLKKLFSRGEYNNGLYLNSSNHFKIINPEYQNHRGIQIGSVLETKPFKDIYEILIITNGYEIKQNDGLKFVYNNQEQSIGVGGVKKLNKKDHYLIYSKTRPKEQSEVFLTVDSAWENELENTKNKIEFSAYFEGKVGKKPMLKLKVKNVEISQILFDNLEKAKNQGLTYETIKECLEKTNDTPFVLRTLKANIENVFMARSQLNELRRLALSSLEKALIKNNEKDLIDVKKDTCFYEENKNYKIDNNQQVFIEINEDNNLQDILKNFNGCLPKIVFSPMHFSLENVENFYKNCLKNNIEKFYLNLPKVARKEDFEKIENIILNFNKNQIGVVANNISGLNFVKKDYEVIGGVYLNIANNFTAKFLNDIGVKFYVKSFENFASEFNLGLTYCGRPDLMTFCHCPYKTNYKNKDCSECKFNGRLTYTSQNGKEYKIRRIKVNNCYFELVSEMFLNEEKLQNKNIYISLKN